MTVTTMSGRSRLISGLIRSVPDFPEPGVDFKDISPLLANPNGFQAAVEELVATAPRDIDVVVGIEARGFVFAAPVALSLGIGFVPVRKPGKLPREVYSQSFDLEYGSETLTVHRDAVARGARVMIVDDILATGGTIAATAGLLRHLDVDLAQVSVLMELPALGGRATLAKAGIESFDAVVTG